jgi:hypothetical protein
MKEHASSCDTTQKGMQPIVVLVLLFPALTLSTPAELFGIGVVFTQPTVGGTPVLATTTSVRRIRDTVYSTSLNPPDVNQDGTIGFITCWQPSDYTAATLAVSNTSHSLSSWTNVTAEIAALANVIGCDVEASPAPVIMVYTILTSWFVESPVIEIRLTATTAETVSLLLYANAEEWFPVPELAVISHGITGFIYGWSCTTVSLKVGTVEGRAAYIPDKVLGRIERFQESFEPYQSPVTSVTVNPSTIVFLYFSGPSGFNQHTQNPPQLYVNTNTSLYSNDPANRPENETAVRLAGLRMGISSNASLDWVDRNDLGMSIYSQWNTLAVGFDSNYDEQWAPEVTQPGYVEDRAINGCTDDWCGGYASLQHARCRAPMAAGYLTRTVQITTQINYDVSANFSGKSIVVDTKANSLADCAIGPRGQQPCINGTVTWPPVALPPVVIPVNLTSLDRRHIAPAFVQVLRAAVAWGGDEFMRCTGSNVTVTFDTGHSAVALAQTGVPAFVAVDELSYYTDTRSSRLIQPRSVFFEVDMGARLGTVVSSRVTRSDVICVITEFANGTRDTHCPSLILTEAVPGVPYSKCDTSLKSVNSVVFFADLALRANINYTATDKVSVVLNVRANAFTELGTNLTFPSQDQLPVVLSAPTDLWQNAPTPSPSPSFYGSQSASFTKSPSWTRTSTTTPSFSRTRSTTASITLSSSTTRSRTMTRTSSRTPVVAANVIQSMDVTPPHMLTTGVSVLREILFTAATSYNTLSTRWYAHGSSFTPQFNTTTGRLAQIKRYNITAPALSSISNNLPPSAALASAGHGRMQIAVNAGSASCNWIFNTLTPIRLLRPQFTFNAFRALASPWVRPGDVLRLTLDFTETMNTSTLDTSGCDLSACATFSTSFGNNDTSLFIDCTIAPGFVNNTVVTVNSTVAALSQDASFGGYTPRSGVAVSEPLLLASPTPTPSTSPSVTPTISETPTRTPSDSRTPSFSKSPTPSISYGSSASTTPTFTRSVSNTPSVTGTGSETLSVTDSSTETQSTTSSSSFTQSISFSATFTQTPTFSPSVSPSDSASPSASSSDTTSPSR